MTVRYSLSLRGLHWLMAAIIFAAIALGVWANYLPHEALRANLLTLHKSLGITALALLVLRAAARLAFGAPPYRPPLNRLNSIAAHSVHGLLYVLMLAMPVSGYIHSMAGGHGFDWFGLFPVPDIIPRDKAADAGAGEAHYLLAWVIGGLLTLHVLAVIWHVARRDGVLGRMTTGVSA